MSALTSQVSSSSGLCSRSTSSRRGAYASFRTAVNSRSPRLRVNAVSWQEPAEQQAVTMDRRAMLALSAALPLMLQQSAYADEGERPS